MSEGEPRRIPIETLSESALARFHVLQLIGEHHDLGVVNQTLAEQVASTGVKLNFYPHNTFKDLISEFCNLGLVERGTDGDLTVKITDRGTKMINALLPGIPEALGLKRTSS